MTEWVNLGSEELRKAQQATGLSNERLARELNLSEKTWRRWVQKGAVPRHMLPTVAGALNLEIETPPARRLTVQNGSASDLQALREQLSTEVGRLRDLNDRIEQRLDEQASVPPVEQRHGR